MMLDPHGCEGRPLSRLRSRIHRVVSTQYSVLCALSLVTAQALFCTGCATTTGDLLPGGNAATTGKVAQVSTLWHNQVIFAPDPMHNGEMTPGIAGRVYLFGPNIREPLVGSGDLVVELFDPSRKGPDGGPIRLNIWTIDRQTLSTRLQHDMIGWGYTLLLPWLEYRAELTDVVIKVHYQEPKSMPIYSEPSKVAFNPVQDFQSQVTRRPALPAGNSGIVQTSHQVPAGSRQP